MEMPINVMIMLFVAIVVGGVMIGFSDRIINTGEQRLLTLGQYEEQRPDLIVQLGDVTQDQIIALAQQCARDKIASPSRELCFVIRGNIDDNNLGDAIEFQLDTRTYTIDSDHSSTANALFMEYQPAGSKIIITS